jgi:hypothetical protein
MDSFLLGCIPVFFMESDEFDLYLPYYFQGWARNASVLIDPEPFLAGKVDLFRLLSSISAQRVGKMQALIARHAKRLVYSIDHVHNDALDLILEAHWRAMIFHAN